MVVVRLFSFAWTLYSTDIFMLDNWIKQCIPLFENDIYCEVFVHVFHISAPFVFFSYVVHFLCNFN